MDNSLYINIARQSGLLKEMNIIANNIANVSTNGYRRQAAVFSEYIAKASGDNISDPLKNSVSMGRLGAHYNDFSSGVLKQTGGSFDLAIEGEGFFLIETASNPALSRAGAFMTDRDGVLITPDGNKVLDESGSPIIIPPDTKDIAIAGDGSISSGGQPLGKIGIVIADYQDLRRIGDNLWVVDGVYEPYEGARILQGFLESSNVNPVIEIARMIEVSRAYEAGQKLLDIQDERLAKTIRAAGQPP